MGSYRGMGYNNEYIMVNVNLSKHFYNKVIRCTTFLS